MKYKKVGFVQKKEDLEKTINPFFNHDYFAMVLQLIQSDLKFVEYVSREGLPCPFCKEISSSIIPNPGYYKYRTWRWNANLVHMVSNHQYTPSLRFCRYVMQMLVDFQTELRIKVK